MIAEPLVEVGTATRQGLIESKRRWFHTRGMDLFVWIDDSDEPFRFELCYPKGAHELSLRWEVERGFEHALVDSGSGAGLHTSSQLLGGDAEPDIPYIAELFTNVAANVPTQVKNLVAEALRLYPQSPVVIGRRPSPATVRSRWPLYISGDGLVWVVAVLVALGVLYALL